MLKLNTVDTNNMIVMAIQTLSVLMGPRTHPSDVWVLSIVDTKESRKLQQQLGAHWGIAMDPRYKADLGLRWFHFPWFVGDFQSPNGSKLYTLTQTGHKREENRTLRRNTVGLVDYRTC